MLQVDIIGHLGADAELKQINGKEYVTFSVAHSETTKNEDGTTSEKAVWLSVLQSGNGGKLLQYLTKGMRVFVRGRLTVKVYQSKSGSYEAGLSCMASEIYLCGNKSDKEDPKQE